MGSEVSEDNFHDHLTLGLTRTLRDLPGVQNVILEEREPCEKSLLNSWEQRHSCILPFDLKNFYLSTDGFQLTWCFSNGERPVFRSTCKIFELDTCRDVASVCLVYVEHKITPSIWLLDRSLEWHFLSPSFTQYFRMMLVYQGLPEWQYNMTSIGLAPWAEVKCNKFVCSS
ncbi:unnamed protein product [Nesidiocoris tenuis]|uniref:Knr4/Smi1-like domain-containing protein n=1 Tax=Nesidiocoris tenuis TaxID=355587 RepID=A0A6H5GEX9_9HEMI|nr:unnamed protein product [Nesidiocoris tenuis]